MKKEEFLEKLRKKLVSLPEEEIEKSISYYEEIINDRIEDGSSEKDAIKALGNMNTIVNNIMYDMSIPTLVKARITGKKKTTVNKVLLIILTILGLPLWFPILIAILSIILSIYIVLWAVLFTIFVLNIGLAISGLGMFLGGVVLCFVKPTLGLCSTGMGLVALGISIILFKPCILLFKYIVKATAFVTKKIKSFIIVKEAK